MTADHHPAEPAPIEARVAAIESVLVERGILDTDTLDQIVQHFEDNLGPMNGAKVVALAWSDPSYKERLLADGTAAIAELGFDGPQGELMVVVENNSGEETARALGIPVPTVWTRLHHARRHHPQARLLKPTIDFADQVTADAVRLDDGKSALDWHDDLA